MKTLWIVVSTLAIANLLGVLGFVGWLAATDRLSSERVQKIRALLGRTISDEAAQTTAEAAAADQEQKQKAEAARMAVRPESAADAIERSRQQDDARQQTLSKMRDETRQLQASLEMRQAAIDVQKKDLDAREKALQARFASATRAAADEQFKAALATLEAQKPAEALKVLQALISQKKRDEAITYLAAMQERTRGRVLAEFIKADQQLAADLLEQLRTRGVQPVVAEPKTPPVSQLPRQPDRAATP